MTVNAQIQCKTSTDKKKQILLQTNLRTYSCYVLVMVIFVVSALCLFTLCKAYRTLAAIQDTAASVNARRQRRQSDRYTLPTSVLAHTAVQHSLFHTWQSLDTRRPVSRCGLAVRRLAGKQKDLGSIRFGSPFSSLQKLSFMDTVL